MLTLYKVVPQRLEYYLEATKERSPGLFYEREGYWRVPGKPTADTSAVITSERLLGLGRGIDPRTGEVLNRFQRQVQTCAIDLTFAAPKGVSMLFALGNDHTRSTIESAQRNSVFETMDFVDRKIISVSRRVAGVRNLRRARTIDQAVFEHRTSRSLDPHLHSHVLIPNLASDDQVCWSAFDLRPIFVYVSLLGALYRSGLRHHLSRSLGVRWREIQPGWYDLEGISPPMIRAFSQRQQEIFNEISDLGLSSHRATMIAAGRSRSARKFGVGYEELLETWRTRAYRLGISTSRLEEMTGNRQVQSDEIQHQLAQAISNCGANREEIMLFDLLRGLAEGTRAGISVGELESGVESAVTSRMIPVPRDLWPYGPKRGRATDRDRFVQIVKSARVVTPEFHQRSTLRPSYGEQAGLREPASIGFGPEP